MICCLGLWLPALAISQLTLDDVPPPPAKDDLNAMSPSDLSFICRRWADYQSKQAVSLWYFRNEVERYGTQLQIERDSLARAKNRPAVKTADENLRKNRELAARAERFRKRSALLAEQLEGLCASDSAIALSDMEQAYSQMDRLYGELTTLLPAQKPLALLLPPAGIAESDSDDPAAPGPSPAPSTPKPRAQGPRTYKVWRPQEDLELFPPPLPCVWSANLRDDFSGELRRELKRAELLRHDHPKIPHKPGADPYVLVEAWMSSLGSQTTLHLQFTVRDANARIGFGALPSDGALWLKTISGETLTLSNARADEGVSDASGQVYTYKGQYLLDKNAMKKLRKSELDKIRVAWRTGYEDYDVQQVDLIQRMLTCLASPQ